ncbi:MAG: hypothetical protein Q9157_003067 [Trypethelium eluteriae]
MASVHFEVLRDDQLIEVLNEAATLFSEHYGIWGAEAEKNLGTFATAGRRVQMTARRLRAECLPEAADNIYVRVKVNGKLAGHVCATRWMLDGRKACWITQLVVARKLWRRRLATGLLLKLRDAGDHDGLGVLSSHPATILIALQACGRALEGVDSKLIGDNVRAVMACSPVSYVRKAKLHGKLFEDEVEDGSVLCVNTHFYVDHREPLEALQEVRKSGHTWPFGELPEGHEFLVFVKTRTEAW